MPRAVCQNCGYETVISAIEAAGILEGGAISKECPACGERAEFKAPIDSEVETDA